MKSISEIGAGFDAGVSSRAGRANSSSGCRIEGCGRGASRWRGRCGGRDGWCWRGRGARPCVLRAGHERLNLLGEGRAIAVTQRGQRQPLRCGRCDGGPQVIQYPIAVLLGDRFAEQDDVRRLPVDGDHRRVRRGHQHELRPQFVADELTQGVRLGRLWLDGEHTAHFSLRVWRHPEVLPVVPAPRKSCDYRFDGDDSFRNRCATNVRGPPSR